MKHSVCYECQERHVGCHGQCEKYMAEREANMVTYKHKANMSKQNGQFAKYIADNQKRQSRRYALDNTMRGEKVWVEKR